jgi:hypothetical protein
MPQRAGDCRERINGLKSLISLGARRQVRAKLGLDLSLELLKLNLH